MDYESTRYYLFANSFVASKLSSYIRRKYDIPDKLSSSEWVHVLATRYLDAVLKYCSVLGIKLTGKTNIYDLIWALSGDIEDIIIPEFKRITSFLEIDNLLFKIYVLYKNIPSKVSGPEKIYEAFSFKGISDPGMYIKLDSKTTNREVVKLLKEAKNRILAQKIIDGKSPKTFLSSKKRKDIGKDDAWKIKAYLRVEKEMKKIDAERGEADSWEEGRSDYANELVGGAIERVAGDLLSEDTLSDKDFEEALPKYMKRIRTYYYEVARRYALPTLKKYRTIFRLMTTQA